MSLLKFIFKIFIYFSIIFVCDQFIGAVLDNFLFNSKGGETKRMMDIYDKRDEDLLIMGSSRAIHHYVPKIIEDSLDLKSYNCGREANGIIFNYPVIKNILTYHKPKIIIYDYYPPFDIIDENNDEKYLGWLRYIYDRDGIEEIFKEVDKTETFKMVLKTRRYNSKFIQIISDRFSSRIIDEKGYRPFYGVMDTIPTIPDLKDDIDFVVDTLKLRYLEKFIDLCKDNDIDLIFSISPWCGLTDKKPYDYIYSIANRYSIPVINHLFDKGISDNCRYFQDSAHMNADGAELFTNQLINEIDSVHSNYQLLH